MRPIGPNRPNRFIAAVVFGALLAVAALRIGGAQSNEFRFEDYTGDKYGSQFTGHEAAKAHLYQLFPKGSQPERLAEFIVSLGGDCMERSEPNYTRRYGNALYCRYRHVWPGKPYAHNMWIVHIFRENDENEISKIELKSRLVAP